MTTHSTTQADRYTVGDYVTIADRRGRVKELVQIVKITPSRYTASTVGCDVQGNLMLVCSKRFFSRLTGECIDAHNRGERLVGDPLSEFGAIEWMKLWLAEQAADRLQKVQREFEMALRDFDAGVQAFGMALDRQVTQIQPVGTAPIFQFIGELKVRGCKKLVMLQWSRRVVEGNATWERSQVDVDFWMVEWQADTNRWSRPEIWWGNVMSSEAIDQAAETRAQAVTTFMYGMALGAAILRIA